MAAEHRSARRYYLAQRLFHERLLSDMALVWRAKQEAEPGTTLPATFPLATQLAAAGYTTDTDLEGADVGELMDAGFSKREAEAILAAAQLVSEEQSAALVFSETGNSMYTALL